MQPFVFSNKDKKKKQQDMYNGIHNAWDLFCVLARLCSAHLIHSSLFLFIACCLNMMLLMCVYDVYA